MKMGAAKEPQHLASCDYYGCGLPESMIHLETRCSSGPLAVQFMHMVALAGAMLHFPAHSFHRVCVRRKPPPAGKQLQSLDMSWRDVAGS